MKYAKFQYRSPDIIPTYTALYIEKWSLCWRQQFARVTQKPRVDVSKSHASCKNILQVCNAIKHREWSRMQAY